MTATYNPYQSRERHRRAAVRQQSMPLLDYLRCIAVTAIVTVAALLIFITR